MTTLKFTVTEDSGLDAVILNGVEHGAALDSSHRNKNENVAPVTFITTTNANYCMEPGVSQVTI